MAGYRQRGSGAKSLGRSRQEGAYGHVERLVSSRLLHAIATNDKGLHDDIEADKLHRKAEAAKHVGKGNSQPRTALSYPCKIAKHKQCTAMKCKCTCHESFENR